MKQISNRVTVIYKCRIFVSVGVAERWKQELSAVIRDSIHAELWGSDLEVFL